MSTDSAGLFPEFEQLEAFAGAQLEDSFHSILKTVRPIMWTAMMGSVGMFSAFLGTAEGGSLLIWQFEKGTVAPSRS